RSQYTSYVHDTIPKVQSSKVLAATKDLLEKAKNKSDHCPVKMTYLKMILEGRKTIEGRINIPPFNNFKEGSLIRFFCHDTEAYCVVTKVVAYKSFAEMLEREGVKPCLPDVKSLKDAIEIYDKIPGYTDKAQKFGVVAIHIKLLS